MNENKSLIAWVYRIDNVKPQHKQDNGVRWRIKHLVRNVSNARMRLDRMSDFDNYVKLIKGQRWFDNYVLYLWEGRANIDKRQLIVYGLSFNNQAPYYWIAGRDIYIGDAFALWLFNVEHIKYHDAVSSLVKAGLLNREDWRKLC